MSNELEESHLPLEKNVPNKLTIDTLTLSERGEDVYHAKDLADLVKQLGI